MTTGQARGAEDQERRALAAWARRARRLVRGAGAWVGLGTGEDRTGAGAGEGAKGADGRELLAEKVRSASAGVFGGGEGCRVGRVGGGAAVE